MWADMSNQNQPHHVVGSNKHVTAKRCWVKEYPLYLSHTLRWWVCTVKNFTLRATFDCKAKYAVLFNVSFGRYKVFTFTYVKVISRSWKLALNTSNKLAKRCTPTTHLFWSVSWLTFPQLDIVQSSFVSCIEWTAPLWYVPGRGVRYKRWGVRG